MSLPQHNLRLRPSFHRACHRAQARDADEAMTAVPRVAAANRHFLHPWLRRNSHRRLLLHSLSINAEGRPNNAVEASSSVHNRSRHRRTQHRRLWHLHNSRHRHQLHSLANNVAGQPSNVAGESNNARSLLRRRKMQHLRR